MLLRPALLLFAAGGAFILAIVVMRRLRQSLVEVPTLDAPSPATSALPVHLYSTVIQQLKQQKHELEVQNIAEQRRARTSDNFSQTVLSNLPSGVLVFALNGLVKQANRAARDILGFQSLPGMSANDIFRNAAVCSPDASAFYSDGLENLSPTVADEIETVLHENGKRRQIETQYCTPGGESLHLAVTVSPVPSSDGGLLGVACLIADRTEIETIRSQQQSQNEISAEMALQLRTSLTTISGYAQQLADNRQPAAAQQLAMDISSEAAALERRIAGLLAEKRSAAVANAPLKSKGNSMLQPIASAG
jgi:PAS domain-containing protein